MYRINKRNWDAFVVDLLRDFEERMVAHLAKFYPAECATLGEEQVRRLIGYGVERARSHGLTSERATCIYIDVMFAFGRDFDRDPALPWASQVLSRKDLDSSRARMVCLFARAYEHRDQAQGLRAEGGLS
jgi:hypothetical protein